MECLAARIPALPVAWANPRLMKRIEQDGFPPKSAHAYVEAASRVVSEQTSRRPHDIEEREAQGLEIADLLIRALNVYQTHSDETDQRQLERLQALIQLVNLFFLNHHR